MKKRLLLSVAFFGAAAAVSSSALAAPPIYNWTGCYVGVNAGYSWGHTSVDGNATGLATLGLPTAFSTTLSPDGFIGGGQVGCNWQNSNAVWGTRNRFTRVPHKKTAALALLTLARAASAKTLKQGFGGLAQSELGPVY